jgi:type I restriction enzyme, R subunit
VNEAFRDFLADGSATAQQIEFVDLIIDHLTARGVMNPGLLYESPSLRSLHKGLNRSSTTPV